MKILMVIVILWVTVVSGCDSQETGSCDFRTCQTQCQAGWDCEIIGGPNCPNGFCDSVFNECQCCLDDACHFYSFPGGADNAWTCDVPGRRTCDGWSSSQYVLRCDTPPTPCGSKTAPPDARGTTHGAATGCPCVDLARSPPRPTAGASA